MSRDDEPEKRAHALKAFVPRELPKLERDDFPPNIPADAVDRIVAADAQRYHWKPWEVLAFVAVCASAIGLFVATKVFGWAYWVPPVVTGTLLASVPLLRFLDGRRINKVIVAQGLKCPKCQQPMFTDTWSRTSQEEQRHAMLQGRCPRCFEHLESPANHL